MATTAVVQLTVDETGASAGFTRLEAAGSKAISKLSGGVGGLAERLRQARIEAENLGKAHDAAGEAAAAGFQKANAHALTNLDTVRLLRDDLGVKIPRAMEKLISQSAAFKAVAAGAFGALAVVGSLQLVFSIVKSIGGELSNWAHFILGDGKAVQDFYKQLIEEQKQLQATPKNNALYMDTQQRLRAELQILETRKALAKTDAGGINPLVKGTAGYFNQSLGGMAYTQKDDARAAEIQDLLSKATKFDTQHNKDLNDKSDAANRETDLVGKEGYNQAAQERKNAYAEIQKQERDQTVTHQQAMQQRLDVDRKYNAQVGVLNRQTADTIRDLWTAANAQRYQGDARAFFDNEAAKAKFVEEEKHKGTKDTEIYSGTAAMDAKYLAEKAERQRVAMAHIQQLQDQANVDALEGTAKLYAEQAMQLDALVEARRVAGQTSSEYDKQYAAEELQIRAKTTAEIKRMLGDYQEGERQLSDQLDARGAHGFAQIAAQVRQQIDEEQKTYEKLRSGLNDSNDADGSLRGGIDATHARKVSEISQAGNNKASDLYQANAQKTQQMEEDAASVRSGAHRDGLLGIFAQEQQQTARLQAEYDKQLAAWKKECDDQVLVGQQAADRKKAIDDQYNAKQEQDQIQLRDKLAGEIEGAFNNPMAALKNAMKHQMAEIIADWIMQLHLFKPAMSGALQPSGGGAAGGAGASQGGGGLLGGLLGRVMGTAGRTPPFTSGGATISSTGDYSSAAQARSATYSAATGSGFGTTAGGTFTPNNGRSATQAGSVGIAGIGQDILSMAGSLGVGGRPASAPQTPVSSAADSASSDGDSPDYSTRGGVESGDSAPGPSGAATASADPALGEAAKIGTAGFAAYGGGKEVYNSFTESGSKGALDGAMGGVEAGAAIGSFFGPEGTLIGGAIGGAAGLATNLVGQLSGEAGKMQAREYYRKTLFPEFEEIRNGFGKAGSGDYLSSVSTANSDYAQGKAYMSNKFGLDASDWVDSNYLKKEFNDTVNQIERMARSGSANIGRTAAEFHDGGVIGGFGDFATSSDEGFIHALRGETIMDRDSSSTHAPVLSAMRSGASTADIASMYMGGMRGPSSTAPVQQAGDSHTWNINALDMKSFAHSLNNGGAQVIAESMNRRAGLYSGDSY